MSADFKKSFLGQLTHRKVTRVAIAYVVVAWMAMQVGEVTFEALALPDWSLSLLIAMLVIGFPVALVIAWAYEVTPQGIRKDLSGKWSRTDDGLSDTASAHPSIAVLPFQDLSEHGDQGYFCEGLAEEILNYLCKIDGLSVASRITSFQIGRNSMDVRKIGRQLGVQTVLEGTVRRAGNHVRITVELLKTADGYHLWSHQYDRTMEDVFDIQQDVARSVAHVLRVSLDETEGQMDRVCNPRAFEFLLRGNGRFARRTEQDLVQARQMFIRALEIDPEYGRAWAGLASTYGFEFMFFNANRVNRDEALKASAKAVELLPDRAMSHVLFGIAQCMARNYGLADEAFQTAINIDPKNYDAFYFYARTKARTGQLQAALELFERAAEIRPQDYESVLLQAQLHVSLGNPSRALEVSREGIARVRKALALDPEDNRARNLGAFALLRAGHPQEAAKWMDASIAQAPNDSIVQYNAACFYALQGETEKALDSLQNSLGKVGYVSSDWLANDSDLDSLRQHPRFSEILASVKDRDGETSSAAAQPDSRH
jgi:adenylate cyclase